MEIFYTHHSTVLTAPRLLMFLVSHITDGLAVYLCRHLLGHTGPRHHPLVRQQRTRVDHMHCPLMFYRLISERSLSAKLRLNESTKRNAWLSLRDRSTWRATNSEECDVVWRNRYFCFLARLASLLLKPWCTTIEQGDTTRPAVDFSEPSEVLKE